MSPSHIDINESFLNPYGKLEGWDAHDDVQGVALRKQSHVDIKNFWSDVRAIQAAMLHFDQRLIEQLEGLTMTELGGQVTLDPGEQWTEGTVGRLSAHNNWHGLSLECTPGTNTTCSTIDT